MVDSFLTLKFETKLKVPEVPVPVFSYLALREFLKMDALIPKKCENDDCGGAVKMLFRLRNESASLNFSQLFLPPCYR